jgi:hypothetical protein
MGNMIVQMQQMRKEYSMIQNVHFNQLGMNATMECVCDRIGLVVMDSVLNIDLVFNLMNFKVNVPVFASSITCAKRMPHDPNGHYLTENAMNLLIMWKLLRTIVLT